MYHTTFATCDFVTLRAEIVCVSILLMWQKYTQKINVSDQSSSHIWALDASQDIAFYKLANVHPNPNFPHFAPTLIYCEPNELMTQICCVISLMVQVSRSNKIALIHLGAVTLCQFCYNSP
jgi:hypothetical protein